jgi:hypothetical protein
VIILERLEALLGYRTKALLSLADFIPENQSGSDDELNRLKDQIQSAPGNKVMLVMDANQWLVIPYQER